MLCRLKFTGESKGDSTEFKNINNGHGTSGTYVALWSMNYLVFTAR
jgi:hypothetical protein